MRTHLLIYTRMTGSGQYTVLQLTKYEDRVTSTENSVHYSNTEGRWLV